MRPSFLGHAINGLLLVVATIMLYCQSHLVTKAEFIIIIALLSIAYGVHSLLHHYEEIYYNFNPLENKWGNKNKN
jgi:hypothetical protein